MERLTDEDIFNLYFKTSYKAYSPELTIYSKGVNDGADAQLAKCKEYLKSEEAINIIINIIKECDPDYIEEASYGDIDYFAHRIIKLIIGE